MKHHGFSHTNIEFYNDGSATVHHVHHDGPHKDVKHAVSDLDEVHDSLEDNLRHPPNEDQIEEEIVPGLHDEVAKRVQEGE